MDEKITEIITNIGIILVLLLFFTLMVLSLYHGANVKYKYTVDVNCYDNYNNMIENTKCKHDVYCGPWQKSTPFRDTRFPCNKGEQNG